MLEAIRNDNHLNNIKSGLNDRSLQDPKLLRKKVIPYNDRLNHCLRYGELLRLKCDEYGFNFVNINKMFKTSLNEYTIPRSLFPKHKGDHHLNSGVNGVGSLYINTINR